MIIFLYGADTFRSRQQLKKMIEKFKADRDPQGLNVARLDAEQNTVADIRQQIFASPFLAERKLVVIENLLISKNQDLVTELETKIEEKSLPDTTVLIFWEATDKFKTNVAKKFFDRLKKEKYTQSFESLVGSKLLAWGANEAREKELKISRESLDYLVRNVGSDMWRLNSLLDQLVAYSVGETESLEIGLEDVKLFLDEKADDNIFNLVDAIVAKQPRQVFDMIAEQYRGGKDALYVFGMILRQFRILLELRDLGDREDISQSNVLAQKVGLHPYVVKKSLPLVHKYGMPELRDIYERLLEFDIQIKTGGGDQKVLLDILVGRVSSGKK